MIICFQIGGKGIKNNSYRQIEFGLLLDKKLLESFIKRELN
jgi:hypothetical protein